MGKLKLLRGSFIDSRTSATGRAGDISINASRFVKISASSIFGGADPDFEATAVGDPGTISINTPVLSMDPGGPFGFSQIVGRTNGPGRGADIRIRADDIRMTGSSIDVSVFGSGRGGSLDVQAKSIRLDGTSVFSDIDGFLAFTGDPGFFTDDGDFVPGIRGSTAAGGDILVRTDSLRITNGAQINAATYDQGDGGNVTIKAKSIVIDGANAFHPSGIVASTSRSGEGGDVVVDADTIELRDGAVISANSIGAGVAGQVSIRAAEQLRLFDDSRIGVETSQADAGDIDIQAGSLLHLRDSAITTSVAGGLGSGGNINIDPTFVILDNGQIIANAFEGRGGNIRIVSDFFFASPDSLVDASSELGISGSVVIDSPETDLTGGLAELPANFLDAAANMTQRCAERLGTEVSRLVVRPYEVLPDSPYALRVALPQGSVSSVNLDREHASISAGELDPLGLQNWSCDG